MSVGEPAAPKFGHLLLCQQHTVSVGMWDFTFNPCEQEAHIAFFVDKLTGTGKDLVQEDGEHLDQLIGQLQEEGGTQLIWNAKRQCRSLDTSKCNEIKTTLK